MGSTLPGSTPPCAERHDCVAVPGPAAARDVNVTAAASATSTATRNLIERLLRTSGRAVWRRPPHGRRYETAGPADLCARTPRPRAPRPRRATAPVAASAPI